ncbi:MAG: hypothetical protein OXI66_10755 [Boseongicola sp.]|nr:hypothetical protein [Boseongicola sp.]
MRREPRSARPGASGKERDGVGEAAAGDMHDEIDGTVAGLREVVETQLRRPGARTRGSIDVIQDALGVADLPSPDRCAEGRDGGEDDLDQDVAADLPHFIEGIYNATRLHSALGYLSPNKFEEINALDGSKSAG